MYLVALFAGIILLYSGCKVKNKTLKTVELTDNSHYRSLDSSRATALQSYSRSVKDSFAQQSHEKGDRKIRRTIDININLDSGGIKADSGQVDVNNLVNRALSNAKSLSVKIQEEILEHNAKTSRSKLFTADSSKLSSAAAAKYYSQVDDQKNISSSTKESSKIKNSTPAGGADWWWIIKVLGLVCLGIYIYLKIKKS